MKKRIITAGIAICLILSACGDEKKDNPATENKVVSSENKDVQPDQKDNEDVQNVVSDDVNERPAVVDAEEPGDQEAHLLSEMDFRIHDSMLLDDVVEYTVPEIGRY